MAERIIYSGPASKGRLVITARPGRVSIAGRPVWLVRFTCHGQRGKRLDQCAVWMPSLNTWDRWRWHPIGSRLIPPAVLGTVEAWLRGRTATSTETTTTTEAS